MIANTVMPSGRRLTSPASTLEICPGDTYLSIMPKTEECTRCHGVAWVCEEHPDKPMFHDGCGGAGMPCPQSDHPES